MTKDRLLAFSDGCIAIFITIILLTFEMPEGASFSDLRSMVPAFVGYVISFVMIGTYWGNHHHLMQATAYIDGRIMWTNMAWFVPDRRIARAFHIRALEEKDRADQEMAEEEMKAAAAAGAHHSAN